MSPRKANTKSYRSFAAALLFLCALFLHPDSAHAQNPYLGWAYAKSDYFINRWDEGKGYHAICPIDQYNNEFEKSNNRAAFGILKRIVVCAQAYIIPSTYIMLWEISRYFAGVVAAACWLAVTLLGATIAMGRASNARRAVINTALKIGAVSTFTFMFGGLFPVLIGIVDELTTIASSYMNTSATMYCEATINLNDIWARVDCAIDTLVGGIFSEWTLAGGLVGFLMASLFSGAFGMFIALIGAVIIAFLIFALLRATYITITAYVALALMALVSPIFITMLLFQSTYGYFEKWLKVTIQFLLQPIFLFAYLAMMLAAYDTVVYDGRFSIYRAVVPEYAVGSNGYSLAPYPRTSGNKRFQLGRWMEDNGMYAAKDAVVAGVQANPALQPNVKAMDSGTSGTIAEAANTNPDLFYRRDAFGYGMNYLNASDFQMGGYILDIPIKKVDWLRLACSRVERGPCYRLTGNAQTDAMIIDNVRVNYQIQLFLSMIIALITMYIFYIMLDMLPFIGSGLAGEELPDLRKKDIGMPGGQMMKQLKASMRI